ncbi:helix-turn-helix domain-containing protein [Methylobacterium sp. P31]
MAYRVPTSLDLSAEERAELESWARRRKTAQGLALRAGIVLLAADGESNTTVAAEQSTGKHTVGKWRERFARPRTGGLLDEPRSGAPRRIGDEQVAELIDRTLSERPQGASHWSRRSMSKPI